jgi:hypothetical protein
LVGAAAGAVWAGALGLRTATAVTAAALPESAMNTRRVIRLGF